MLAMPASGSLNVSPDMTSTKALSVMLKYVDTYLSNTFQFICLAVDTFRLGPNENIHSLLQHVTSDRIVISGYADWPQGPGRWFGGSFISCGRPAFGDLADAIREEEPARSGMYWDNWLAKKQRECMARGRHSSTLLNVIQDVPRGGPHPRVSTTLTPDGSVQLRFGGGLCPDAGALMGENVLEPFPIADWILKLKKHATLGVTLVRHSPLPLDFAFNPICDSGRLQPSYSNAILRWSEVDLTWLPPSHFHEQDFHEFVSQELNDIKMELLPDVMCDDIAAPESPLQLCVTALTKGANPATDADLAGLVLWKHLQNKEPVVRGRYVASEDINCCKGYYSTVPEAVWRRGTVGYIQEVSYTHSGDVWARIKVNAASVDGLWGLVLSPRRGCFIRPFDVDWGPDVASENVEEEERLRHENFLAVMADAYRTDNKQPKEGDCALTGQRRVSKITWNDCMLTFQKGVLRPPYVHPSDHRFAFDHGKAYRLRKAKPGTEGYRCDCQGCEVDDTILDVGTPDGDAAVPLLSRCCKSFTKIRLVRDQKDGNFCTDYGNLKKSKMRELYQDAIIDASWKCWHCLAVENGSSYDEIIDTVRHLFFETPYQQKRLETKRKHGIDNLVASDIKRNSTQNWIREAGERLADALRHAKHASPE